MFGTIEAAIDYLQSKLQDFYDRRFEMDSLYQQARTNLQDAYAQVRLIEEAKNSLSEVIVIINDYNDLTDRLKPLASAFNVNTGLGVFPAIVMTAIWYLGGTAAAIAVAEILWSYYQRLDQQRVVVKAVKDGLLSPEILTRPKPPGPIENIASSLTMLLLVGIGGWLLIGKKL